MYISKNIYKQISSSFSNKPTWYIAFTVIINISNKYVYKIYKFNYIYINKCIYKYI